MKVILVSIICPYHLCIPKHRRKFSKSEAKLCFKRIWAEQLQPGPIINMSVEVQKQCSETARESSDQNLISPTQNPNLELRTFPATTMSPIHTQILTTFHNYQTQIQSFQFNPTTTPAASPTFVATAVILYLTTTLFLSRYLTPSLPPNLLRLISIFHNLLLLLLSLSMSLAVSFISVTSLPVKHLFCFPSHNPPEQSGPLFFWAYVYYLSKFIEFVDTLLIILNENSRKRLSFLHVYHHAVVVIMSYLWLSTTMSLFPIALVTNAGVHVLMYGYYMLCAMGIRPRWKRVVTDCQIVQFVFGFLASFVMLYYHFLEGGCAGIWGWVFNALFNASLLYLFVDFHKRNYAEKMKQKKAEADKQT